MSKSNTSSSLPKYLSVPGYQTINVARELSKIMKALEADCISNSELIDAIEVMLESIQ